MKKYGSYLVLFFLFLVNQSYSQSFELSPPKIEFDGSLVSISYDIISQKPTDLFYTWLEIEKANGEKIFPKDLSGDIGPDIRAGTNKKITWTPAQDSVNLALEEVFIEVKAEKYIKSFNKSSAVLQSLVLPGWGQSKIKAAPGYIAGIALYGALAGGFVLHQNALENYDSYKIENDPVKRTDLYNKAQSGLNFSSALMYSAAAAWLANLVWTAVIPNSYKPLQHSNVTLNPVKSPEGDLLLSLKLDF
jgi:hypothetical protein